MSGWGVGERSGGTAYAHAFTYEQDEAMRFEAPMSWWLVRRQQLTR